MNTELHNGINLETLKEHTSFKHYEVFQGNLCNIFFKAVTIRGNALMRQVHPDTPRAITNKYLAKFIMSYLDHIDLLLHKHRIRFYHFGKKKQLLQKYLSELNCLRIAVEHIAVVYSPGDLNG